jgi:hypothetical protein
LVVVYLKAALKVNAISSNPQREYKVKPALKQKHYGFTFILDLFFDLSNIAL